MPDDTAEAGEELVSEATRETERHEAQLGARADRPPTPEEEELAERNELDPQVAEAYREATQRGVDQQGEGQIPG